MRFSLLSSVSFLFLACAPVVAHAGFEFVPPAAAPAVTPAQAAAPSVPVIDNSPVASETLETTPYVDKKTALPAAIVPPPADAPVANVPVIKTPAPVAASDEPMVLGQKAVPLTPVVQTSDALIIDDAPTSMPLPMPTAAANDAGPIVEAPVRTPLASTKNTEMKNADQASGYGSQDVLWDNKTSAISSDLPPALPAASMGSGLLSAPAPIASSDLNDGAPVEGFGRQVPLAMALQQIVPANYRYSFDTGVDPGMRVTWTGGKSWKAVIADVARNNALNVDIADNVVAFRRVTPMDIVSSSSDVDMSADTVQGVPLKVLPLVDTDAMPAPVAATPKTITEEREEFTAKQDKAAANRKAKFDSMLDVDSPAKNMVKNKRILTDADEPKTSQTDESNPDLVAMKAAMDNTAVEAKADAKPAKTVMAEKKINTEPADSAISSLILDEPKTSAAKEMDTVPAKKADAAPTGIIPASGKADAVMASDLPPQLPLPDAAKGDAGTKMASAKDEWMKPLPTDEIAAAPEMSEKVTDSVPADLTTSREWEGFKNQTLRETVTSWAQTAGVSVVWSSEYDYPLQTDVRISANFGDAVRTLLAGFSKAAPRPIGRLFKNDKVGAQPVLVIETQRLTN